MKGSQEFYNLLSDADKAIFRPMLKRAEEYEAIQHTDFCKMKYKDYVEFFKLFSNNKNSFYARLRIIKRYLDFCVDYKWIPFNILQPVLTPTQLIMMDVLGKRLEYVTHNDYIRSVNQIQSQSRNPELLICILNLIYKGIRKRHQDYISNIRMSDIDFACSKIRIAGKFESVDSDTLHLLAALYGKEYYYSEKMKYSFLPIPYHDSVFRKFQENNQMDHMFSIWYKEIENITGHSIAEYEGSGLINLINAVATRDSISWIDNLRKIKKRLSSETITQMNELLEKSGIEMSWSLFVANYSDIANSDKCKRTIC